MLCVQECDFVMLCRHLCVTITTCKPAVTTILLSLLRPFFYTYNYILFHCAGYDIYSGTYDWGGGYANWSSFILDPPLSSPVAHHIWHTKLFCFSFHAFLAHLSLAMWWYLHFGFQARVCLALTNLSCRKGDLKRDILVTLWYIRPNKCCLGFCK